MLGLSLLGWIRYFLSRWGAPWYLWFVLPIMLVAILARKEEDWLPDPELRMRCSRWLIMGSIFIVMVTSWWGVKAAPDVTVPREPQGRAGVQNR